MDQSEQDQLCSEATLLSSQIKESFIHLNNLSLLCEICEEQNAKVQFIAMKETFKVFEYIIQEKTQYSSAFIYKKKEIKTTKKVKTEETYDQIKDFLNLKYTDFVEILLFNHLGNKSSSFQIPAFKMLMRLVLLEYELLSKNIKKKDNPSIFIPILQSTIDFIEVIISILIQGKNLKTNLLLMSYPSFLELIKEFFHEYDDLRYYLLQCIKNICIKKQKQIKLKNLNSKSLESFVLNIFQLLHKLPILDLLDNYYLYTSNHIKLLSNREKKQFQSFSEMCGQKRQRDELDTTTEEEILNNIPKVFDNTEHKVLFQQTWKEVLSLPLSPLVYKQILLDMPEYILPYFSTPELFGDFFTDAYNMGGMSSILALQSIFVLVSQHNLEYKDFYKKLYGLLQPSIFLVQYSGKFFDLCRLFFNSNYVPEYLCAAFCKRLIRLGLKAPPTTFLPVLPLVHNIIASNTQLTSLLHKKPKLSTNTALMVTDKTEKQSGSDPFNMDEKDPAKSNAQQSSLWEITALRQHYYPIISRFCKTFEKPIDEHKDLYEIKDFLHQTYETEFQSQITKKRKGKPIPLTFQRSTQLFSQNEYNDCFLCWELN